MVIDLHSSIVQQGCSESVPGFSLNVFTLPNMAVLCIPFSRHGPCVCTDRSNLPAAFRTPIYPRGSYTYLRFHFHFNSIRRLCGSRGGTWVEVLLRCHFNRDKRSNIKIAVLTGEMVKCASCWPSWERRWVVAFNGAIYEKVTEELSLQGFCRDIKQVVSKIKNMLVVPHL